MNKESSKQKNKPVIGITIGDINGIGPEVIIKALSNNKITHHMTPVIYGSAKVLSFYRKHLNNNHFNFTPLKDIENPHHRKVNVINCWEEMVELKPGQMNDDGGKHAFLALERASKDLVEGKIHGLVTAPISKHNIQNDQFNFPGHTEYLNCQSRGQRQLDAFDVRFLQSWCSYRTYSTRRGICCDHERKTREKNQNAC